MGSEERYYRRRLREELEGVERALTAEALTRRRALVAAFQRKLADIEAARGETLHFGTAA